MNKAHRGRQSTREKKRRELQRCGVGMSRDWGLRLLEKFLSRKMPIHLVLRCLFECFFFLL